MKRVSYQGQGRREHLRLAYPSEFRPILVIGGQKLDVVDISEKGLCFLNPDKVGFTGVVKGRLHFLDGDSVVVAGLVAWENDGLVGLHLTRQGIPYELFFKEQHNVVFLERLSA